MSVRMISVDNKPSLCEVSPIIDSLYLHSLYFLQLGIEKHALFTLASLGKLA